MKMKKKYIAPEILLENLEIEGMLLDFSAGVPSDEYYKGGDNGNDAKPGNFFGSDEVVSPKTPNLWGDDEKAE